MLGTRHQLQRLAQRAAIKSKTAKTQTRTKNENANKNNNDSANYNNNNNNNYYYYYYYYYYDYYYDYYYYAQPCGRPTQRERNFRCTQEGRSGTPHLSVSTLKAHAAAVKRRLTNASALLL